MYALRHGIPLDSIKQMSESEIMEYVQILGIFDEIEADRMEKSK